MKLAEPLRLSGGVWGHLVGDAMGVPYEFRSAEEIGEVRWGEKGTHGVAPGTWSDDGAMMLALLDSLLPDERSDAPRPGGFDLARQGENFVRWARTGAFTPDGDVFDIGNATSAAIRRLEHGVPPDESGGDEETLGNGSLMRSVAIALAGRELTADELADQAERSSLITHAASLAQATCALYVLVCQRLLQGRSRADALARATDDLKARYAQPGREPCAAALETILAWPGRAGRGHVVDSFWSAWDAFAGAESYESTVVRAIRYGRDTDTTACIAGGMAGIHWGIDAIPTLWLSGMRGRHVVQPIVDRLIATAGYSTSYGDPIRVDWVDGSAVPPSAGWAGRLGMTFLPGRTAEDNRGGPLWRDVHADATALAAHGASTLLLLVEDHELESFRATKLAAALEEAGVALVRHPIRDMGIPLDPPAFARTLEQLGDQLKDGRNVVVACRGGLGRTGTSVACMLVDAGLDPEKAIDLTRRTRRKTIESPAQEEFVRQWRRADASADAPSGRTPGSLQLDPAGTLARLHRLADRLPAIERPDFDFGHWAGGETQPDGSITMPYYAYSDEALEFIAVLPVEVFDWPTWAATDEAKSLMDDPSSLAEATPEQLITLTTTLVRGDRFSEGALAWAFDSGLLRAVVRRAAEIVGDGG